MIFEIIWKENALKDLQKLDSFISIRIIKKIDELKENPFLRDIKRLKGLNFYRLRVGDYRIIFEIFDKKLIIFKIGHRKNIYDF